MKGVTLFLLGIFLAGPIWLQAAEPECIVLKEHDTNLVRRALTAEFMEVLSSPTIVDNQDYMEIRLVPNGFLTFVELLLEIKLKETMKGLELHPNIVKEEGGKRIPVYEEDTQKVLFLLLEQVQFELHNAMQTRASAAPTPDGFLLFDEEIARLDKKLGRGPYEISVAAYPQFGRIYKKTNDKTKALEVRLAENPAKPGKALSVQMIWTGSGDNSKGEESELNDWLRTISGFYLKKCKLKTADLFMSNQPATESAAPFKITYQVEPKESAGKKTLLVEEGM